MSRHNYTQYSNPKNNDKPPVEETVAPVAPVDTEEVIVVNTVPEIKMETEPTVTAPITVTGEVANCTKLNVRANPDATAAVVCVINAKTEVEVDVEHSNDEWLKVKTAAGNVGYCMRKYIEI